MAINWLSRTNKPNYQNRADYGIRVARPGFDASSCAQNQLIFNSGWPIMQIMAVVDMRNSTTSYEIIKTTTVTYMVGTMSGGAFVPESTTVTSTEEEVSSVPSGLPSSDISETLTDFYAYSINKKYIKKKTGTATFYDGGTTTESGDLPNNKKFIRDTVVTYIKSEIKTAKHRLGYVPFFFAASSLFGGNSNYVILFSIEITRDADYPYTEAPLPLISPIRDYGIKSSSIFGKNVPGLCTNMFSKLVQAVKTTKTSTYNDGTNDIVYWSPLKKGESPANSSGVLKPYEFYAFVGDGKTTQDGGQYYTRFRPHYISYSSSTTATPMNAYMVGVFGQDTQANGILVVLRSPMVSPEYEEI